MGDKEETEVTYLLWLKKSERDQLKIKAAENGMSIKNYLLWKAGLRKKKER